MPSAMMAHPDLRNPFEKVALGPAGSATVLTRDEIVVLPNILTAPGLWVSPEDLTRINGFVVKPEGACLGDICIPLSQNSDLLQKVGEQVWVCVSAFADLMEQNYIVDEENNIWSFGDMPMTRQAMYDNAQAPDFEILDRQGQVVRMSDFKGKKALIVTWSSW